MLAERVEVGTTAYARAVASGEIVAGKPVRDACARHLRDLDDGAARGLVFDENAADRAIRFFGFLRHSKGEWAGQSFELAPWQQFIVGSLFGWKREDGTRRYRTAYIEVARKNGKTTMLAGIGLLLAFFDNEGGAEVYAAAPLDLDTRIATPSGWTTMGDIRAGDVVFDENGKPVNVTAVSPVFHGRDCYRVRFDDRSAIIADADHLWTVNSVRLGESKAGISPKVSPRLRRTVTTAKLAADLRTPTGALNFRIPATPPLDLPPADLPIAPYTLGVWLGDGKGNRGAIVHHPDDIAIMRRIEASGDEVSTHGEGDLLRYTVLGLRGRLAALGLLDNKHIPVAYMRGSTEQRIALLHGLMDTDGTCTKTGEIRFTNRERRLVEGVAHLLASVGVIANIHSVMVAGKPQWIVSCRGGGVRLFGLDRKAQRQVKPTPRALSRRVAGVDPVPSRPVRCISVDSESGLFLAGESLIATHNTKRDQAKICWSEARAMAVNTPQLRKALTILVGNIHHEPTRSKLEPLGADADSMDGLNVHAAIVDELHAHKTRRIVDVLETATAARRQPLVLYITTAGVDRTSVCFERHEYARRVAEGGVEDDTHFAYVATIDEGDDPFDEAVWIKANPNLGVSVKLDDLQRKAERAKALPTELNAFLRLHLDVWTQQTNRWIPLDLWDEQAGPPVDELALAGRQCYGGLDLSATRDLTAWVMAFPSPDDEDEITVLARVWCPEKWVYSAENRYAAQYQAWAAAGVLTVTEGDAVDYDRVQAQVIEDASRFQVLEVGIDRLFQGAAVGQMLQEEGVPIVAIGQGFYGMAAPMKEFERRLLARKIRHGGNPLLRFCVDNFAVSTDPAGNIKPNKATSQSKIDPVVALVMALDRAMRTRGETSALDDPNFRLTLLS